MKRKFLGKSEGWQSLLALVRWEVIVGAGTHNPKTRLASRIVVLSHATVWTPPRMCHLCAHGMAWRTAYSSSLALDQRDPSRSFGMTANEHPSDKRWNGCRFGKVGHWQR